MLARRNSERTENVPTGGVAHRHGEKETTGRRVLLVDDHNLFREALAAMCEHLANLDENVQAGSLAEARRILSSRNANNFALAVVGLDLPDEGGLELIRELHRSGIPVLAVSRSQDYVRLAGVSGEVLTTAASRDEILGAMRRLMCG